VAVGVTTHRVSPHLSLIPVRASLSLSRCDGFCGTVQGLRMPDERSSLELSRPEYAMPLPLSVVPLYAPSPLSNVSDFIAFWREVLSHSKRDWVD
jgi:hypothetical protein